MMRLKSLRAKLVFFVAVFSILSVAAVAFIAVGVSSSRLREELERDVRKNAASIEHMLEIYKAQALAHARSLAANPSLSDVMRSEDFAALRAVVVPMMERGGLEYLVVTDPKGRVLIRAHQPDAVPGPDDNISNQQNIRRALSGEPFVGIEEGADRQALGARRGARSRRRRHTARGALHGVRGQPALDDGRGEAALRRGVLSLPRRRTGGEQRRCARRRPGLRGDSGIRGDLPAPRRVRESPSWRRTRRLATAFFSLFTPLVGGERRRHRL